MKSQFSTPAHGVISIFTCPKSLGKAVEWALQTQFEHFVIDWKISEVDGTSLCASLTWSGAPQTAARLSSELARIPGIRFEITEQNHRESHHERFAFTPTLGIFRSDLDAAGNSIFTEHQLRAVVVANPNPLRIPNAIAELLGEAWDVELDAYRSQPQMQDFKHLTAVG